MGSDGRGGCLFSGSVLQMEGRRRGEPAAALSHLERPPSAWGSGANERTRSRRARANDARLQRIVATAEAVNLKVQHVAF